jgi:hypothetical protein
MSVSFRQLRLFLALAETGSVSAAAKVMHVTQPTASMQLKDMSGGRRLAALYELVGKKLYLTEVGQELAQSPRVRWLRRGTRLSKTWTRPRACRGASCGWRWSARPSTSCRT